MFVRDIMTDAPIVAEIPGSRDDAVRLLLAHRASGFPVVKAGTRQVAGVLTRSDLLRRPDEEQLALIMTAAPLTIAPAATVSDAARMFHEHHIHTLPVVDRGELVGVLSPTDILRVITSTNGATVRDAGFDVAVPVHTLTPVRVVWEIMKLARQNAAPVLDDRARLTGIVADSDLFRLNRVAAGGGNGGRGATPASIWGQANVIGEHHAATRIDLPEEPVANFMVRDVQTVFEGASVSDAARKLVKHGINQLPVTDSGDRLRGLVTDLGLMRAAF